MLTCRLKKKKSLRERKKKPCEWMLEQEIPDSSVHVFSVKAWFKKRNSECDVPKY